MPASQTRWERAVTDGLVLCSAAAMRSRWTPGYQRVSVAGVAEFPSPVLPVPRRKQACWTRPPPPSSTSTPSSADACAPRPRPTQHPWGPSPLSDYRRTRAWGGWSALASRLRRQVVEGGGRQRVEGRRRPVGQHGGDTRSGVHPPIPAYQSRWLKLVAVTGGGLRYYLSSLTFSSTNFAQDARPRILPRRA